VDLKLRGLGASEGCIADILVATSEACTNVVQHATSTARYEVVASVDEGYCVLKIVDRGKGFAAGPDGGVHADAESGRGIKIMRAVVDDVSFDSRPERGTVVYLQKRLTWRDEAPMHRLQRELVRMAR
jgi:serine/threonine-protein kinase RsbW